MKCHFRTHKAVYFLVCFLFLFYSGCAAGKTTVKNEMVEGNEGNGTAALYEKHGMKPSGSAFQQDRMTDDKSDEGQAAGGTGEKPVSQSFRPMIAEKFIGTPPNNGERVQQGIHLPEKPGENFLVAQAEPEAESDEPGARKKPVNESESRTDQQEASGGTGEVVLNFDNADLYEVIRTLAEILQINYIVDPNVRGRVTIQTAGKLSRDELFPVFFQILEINGLSAVKEGGLYKIIRMKEAAQLPLTTREDDDDRLRPEERMIIQVIPLKYISVQEMTKLLTPFVTAGGTIVSHQDSNTVLVVDKASNLEKVLKLVDVFDIDFFENVDHRFVKLRYISAEDAGESVEEIVSSYGNTVKEGFKAIALPRINSLLLISRQPRVIPKIYSFIRELDVPVEDDEPRIFVYSVKNGGAAELAKLLDAIFGKSTQDREEKETPPEPEEPGYVRDSERKLFPEITTRDDKAQPVPSERIASDGSGTLKKEIKITPDEIRNSLVIEAIPRDYRIIETILSKIDVLPRQVLIEVTIAEITLDASTELGIEWQFDRGEDFVSGLQSGATLGSGGLNFSYAILDQAKRWQAKVAAMAQKGKVDILSSPSVLASDNKEAKINVSTEIPVATTTYTYDPTATDNLLQTSIQYRNTGVILAVTPHINENGLVSMAVNQEVSEQAEQVEVGEGDKRLSFFKRSVDTTLTVKNGQTIVIGGLIRETKSDTTAGVPCMGDVPVLSYLFGKKTSSTNKNELIIFITPKVIASLEDIDIVSEEFRNRIGYDYQNFKVPGSN